MLEIAVEDSQISQLAMYSQHHAISIVFLFLCVFCVSLVHLKPRIIARRVSSGERVLLRILCVS